MEANHLPHMGTPDGRALFERYFASRGEERRRLLGQLVVANTPLVKVLLGQMLGISQGPRAKGYRSMSGQAAFREIPWDEGMQVGMIALLRGFELFRADKGKFSPFLKWRLFHQLQEYVEKQQGLVRNKRGADVPNVFTTDDESFLADKAGGADDPAMARLLGDGEGDDDFAANDTAAPERVRTPLDRFVESVLVFRRPARIAQVTLFGRWERLAVAAGAFPSRRALDAALRARAAMPQRIRVPWSDVPVCGYRGVELASA